MEKMVEMWKDKLKASIEENKTVKVFKNIDNRCRIYVDMTGEKLS